MSTAVAPDIYAGQGVARVEAASLARASHNLGVSTTCAMTTAGHSTYTQPGDCDTVHTLITPAVADLTHDLDRDCHYTHLHKQAWDRKRVLLQDPCAPVSCSIPRRQQLYDTSSFACHLVVVPPTLCSCPGLGSHLGTKPDFVTCCQQTCRAQPNGVGDHAQPLTPPTWQMTAMSIAWLSSLTFPFRFCPPLRASRSSTYRVRGV